MTKVEWANAARKDIDVLLQVNGVKAIAVIKLIYQSINHLKKKQFLIWNAKEVELHAPVTLNAVQIPVDGGQESTFALDLHSFEI